jgi:hypothetical protein
MTYLSIQEYDLDGSILGHIDLQKNLFHQNSSNEDEFIHHIKIRDIYETSWA